jgi:hypothetical protein
MQLLDYADDIDIVARTLMALKEVVLSLEKAAKRIGLLVNEQKTKYMVSAHSHFKEKCFIVGSYKFERVEKFSYLGSLISHDNDVSQEIKQHILVANKCHHGLARQLESRFLSCHNKIKIYKTLIRPVGVCGSETWPLKIGDIENLEIFKRRILRAIGGPIKEREEWHMRNNKELYDLYKEEDIITFIKLGWLRWAGHVIIMEEDRSVKRILISNPGGARGRGRLKRRCEDGVDDGSKSIGIRNWKSVSLNWKTWYK